MNVVANYLNFIGGEWVSASSGETHEHFNPAKPSESIGFTTVSTVGDVEKAVEAAKSAAAGWKAMSSVNRGEILRKAADILEERADDIAKTATQEMGKRFIETKGEALRGASILRYYAQEGMRKKGEVLPSAANGTTLLAVRVPVGVVAAITPWNFPIAIPIWKIAPALVFGNPVVWKPGQETGITAAKVTKVFEDAGLPAGVLNLVLGRGSVVGDVLTTHKDVAAVTFTGSNAVGQNIAKLATEHGKKFQLELGGKNPAVVLEDANLDLAARLVVEGAMKQTGQRCTATSRAYVEASIYDEFVEKVIENAKQITIGDGLQDGITMGPVASKKQFDTVTGYIQKGKDEGAELLYGGSTLDIDGGYYIEPTIFGNATHEMTIVNEEIFGPVVALMKVADYNEALEKANNTIYGLSAAVFTDSLEKAFHFMENSEVGMVQINGETGGAEPQAPFGGTKASGQGPKEQGQSAAEFFTTNKTVTINPFTK
ncbi:aldehyde dehydrogenase family protein [Siminovitchia acidinfaciens]|uniref:Aldehyde dehydrogenase family protein n=1 Tax=Siminovitchia acidinfaciens TaxID=2321395 RepID=A0A429XU27_9BACI|nr:aldehyde dehydrogenase family protein [Siminovitchia acidinfaciens]RST71495.1 aldehyde dehydrogenase family protein [Siminovitchia acidinfaciens]